MSELTHKEASSRGGKATKAKHPDHFRKIAMERWARQKAKENAVLPVDNQS